MPGNCARHMHELHKVEIQSQPLPQVVENPEEEPSNWVAEGRKDFAGFLPAPNLIQGEVFAYPA